MLRASDINLPSLHYDHLVRITITSQDHDISEIWQSISEVILMLMLPSSPSRVPWAIRRDLATMDLFIQLDRGSGFSCHSVHSRRPLPRD